MSKIYTDSDFVKFITKVFGSYQYGNQNVQVTCPRCVEEKGPHYTKRKLAVKLGTHHLVHCWVCGYKSRNLVSLLEKYHREHTREYIQTFLDNDYLELYEADAHQDQSAEECKEEDENKGLLPDKFSLLAIAKNTNHVKRIKEYLVKKRGIPADDLDRELWYWKFGFTPYSNEEYRNRIIIPSFDSIGNVNYFTARSMGRSSLKYKNPDVPKESIIFNEINIDWSKPLTLVEGPFDLIKCNENATCILGSELGYDYKLVRKIVINQTPVVLALDNDAWGKTVSIARLLVSANVEVSLVEIPSNVEDVGAMTKDEFALLLKRAVPFSEEYVLRKNLSRIVK